VRKNNPLLTNGGIVKISPKQIGAKETMAIGRRLQKW
jgi:hypothetical protein